MQKLLCNFESKKKKKKKKRSLLYFPRKFGRLMAKVLNWSLEVSDFELQWRHNIPFWTDFFKSVYLRLKSQISLIKITS